MLSILLALVGLVLLSMCAEFWRGAPRIDRLALVAFIALAVGTRPNSSDHASAVANALTARHGSPGVMMGSSVRAAAAANATTRLEHGDLLVVSFTRLDGEIASVGAFGRVFFIGR